MGKLAGEASRAAVGLVFRDYVYQLLFADDYLWNAAGPQAWSLLVLTLFFLTVRCSWGCHSPGGSAEEGCRCTG